MPETPLEWVKDLGKALDQRLPRLKLYDDYYHGRQALEFTSAKFRQAFGNRFTGFSDNWARVVVDAAAERLTAQGFKVSADVEADPEAWEIWQYNQLDAWSRIAHVEAMVSEQTYALVWPDETEGRARPRVWVESAQQMITRVAAGDRRRILAALKRWKDDSGHLFATLYLPNEVHKFRSSQTVSDGSTASSVQWVDRDEGMITHDFGIPVVPLRNRPGLLREAESELVDVIPHQNAINNLWANLMVAAEHHAVRRPWVIMAELPQDERGNPVNPLERKDLDSIALEGDGEIGTLEETDLTNFIKAIELAVKHVASQSRTPPHYLNSSADRLSGESLRAAETGLVARVREKQEHFGEAWEEVIRLAFRVKGRTDWAEAVHAEVDWKDAEFRTESQHADAVGKYIETAKLPILRGWEMLGESPQQIKRNLQLLAQQALLFAGADIASLIDDDETV